MTLARRLLVPVSLLVAGCAGTSPEMRVVHDAAEALGGLERVRAVKTLVIEGTGENYNLGQNTAPEAPLPVYDVTGYRRAIDFASGRWRVEQLRTAKFPTGTPTARQILAVDGEVGFNVAASGAATRTSALVARDRRAELYHHPLGLLQAATAEGATVANARKDGDRDVVDVTIGAGDRFTLVIDPSSRLPVRIVSPGYHPNLGDVTIETELSDYQEIEGLKLPGRLVARVDEYAVTDIRASTQAVNGDTGDLAAPADVRSAPDPTATAQVEVEEIAPGLWYLTGQSHHSVLVEFADHLALIEAPQGDVRTLAVIARARAIRPDKPLRTLVSTHHHFDHSGGVRAAVSEGLGVVAHAAARAFFESMVARPHTVVADALARNPRPLTIEPVGEKHVLADGTRSVELYPISGSPHAETLLMAYFPAERLLVQADVYSPPAPGATTVPAFPFVPNLLENIERLKLRVDRIVPIHGRVVPIKEMMAHAKPTE